MKIAIPQINYKAGDIDGNSEKILRAIRQAEKEKAELTIFPPLAICGALPQDLLEREDFINACRLAVERLALQCNRTAVLIGAPNLDLSNGIMYNSAYFIQHGEVVDGVHKNILSDYDLLNESRYFVAGEDNTPIRCNGKTIRILFDEYESEFIEPGDHLVILFGSTPFSVEGKLSRHRLLASLAQKYRKDLLFVNHVGGYTSALFDGGSAFYNAKGQQVTQWATFAEDFRVIDTGKATPSATAVPAPERMALIHQALCFGIRDYFDKHGFTKAVLGLSGGIDSAVVAALAAEALGAENVMGILMPSRYSTDHSITDAEALAENLGMPHHTIAIKDIYNQYTESLRPVFGDLPFDVTEENLQARIRGMLVMALSNKLGYIALNTSNKSEAAVGYGTLYGDLCGSLSVIGDLYKTDVYALARHINREREIIPLHTIEKAPSAELHPGQKDQDTLPDYAQLDAILKLHLEDNLSPEAITAKGYPEETVRKVTGMVARNEYKRAQCPPNLKISTKAFGSGRHYPF